MQQSKVLDNQQATEFEIGWLCGIIDGEGCFFISEQYQKSNYRNLTPRFEMKNTNFELIEKFAGILSKLNITCHIDGQRNLGRCKPSKTVRVQGHLRLKKFLDILLPYIQMKKEVAEYVQEFVQSRITDPTKPYSDREIQLFYFVKDHNKRGI